MKATTLWQPLASMVALGAKTLETRSWTTMHRGSLAIHAAKNTPPRAYEEFLSDPRRADLLRRYNLTWDDLPRGAIVATVRLVDVYKTDCGLDWIDSTNMMLGDYSPGRYVWKLTELWTAPLPLYCTGGQRLWDWYMPIDLLTGKRISEKVFRP